MADEKLTNRWLMVAAALVMQLCLGVLYSYSVFRGPLMKEVGFTVKEAGYPLMASFFFFAVGMIVAGRWQDKAGPKTSVPAPNPNTARPVIVPRMSGNHLMQVAIGVTYAKPTPSPPRTP